MSALGGRTIVVTRPRARADAIQSLLLARGASVLAFPTIAITPARDRALVAETLGRIASFDWLVITSATAAEQLLEWRIRLGLRIPRETRIAAVGPATAAALAATGLSVSAMPATALGEAIAGPMGDLAGRSVLVPRADIGRAETVAALEAAGAHVHTVALYHTGVPTPDPDAIAEVRDRADALTFTSPSTVHGFAALLGADAARLLGRLPVACIGRTTTSAARAAGAATAFCAASATPQGLVDALEDAFSDHARATGCG